MAILRTRLAVFCDMTQTPLFAHKGHARQTAPATTSSIEQSM